MKQLLTTAWRYISPQITHALPTHAFFPHFLNCKSAAKLCIISSSSFHRRKINSKHSSSIFLDPLVWKHTHKERKAYLCVYKCRISRHTHILNRKWPFTLAKMRKRVALFVQCLLSLRGTR